MLRATPTQGGLWPTISGLGTWGFERILKPSMPANSQSIASASHELSVVQELSRHKARSLLKNVPILKHNGQLPDLCGHCFALRGPGVYRHNQGGDRNHGSALAHVGPNLAVC